jgi:hypothetical protein
MESQDIVLDYNLINRTRKNRREPEAIPKPKPREEWEDWTAHEQKGDKLYKFILDNFDTMFEGDTLIKEFDIRPGEYGLPLNDIMDTFGDDIQKQLIPWIKNELEQKLLFDRTLWKSKRDKCWITASYLAYKRMFQYKNYFLQLIIDDCCGKCDYLIDDEKCRYDICIHFELALHAWIDEESGHIEPDKCFSNILIDMMYPEKWWNLKNGM